MLAAKTLLEQVTKQFECLFVKAEMGTPSTLSQTGEPYVVVVNDGPLKDGEVSQVYDFVVDALVPGRTIHLNAEGAINQWLEEASKFAAAFNPNSKTLYWRIRPEVDFGYQCIHAKNGMFRMPSYKVYSRFLISDKQELKVS